MILATAVAIAAGVAVVAVVAYVAISVTVAHRFTTALRVPVTGLPADLVATDVALPSRQAALTLHGVHFDAGAGTPAVLFVHGKDACRGSELRAPTFALAEALVASGLSVLMIDLRGHGNSSPGRMTYGLHERLDVLGAVDWLRERGHRRVGVLGASMGAASALFAAAEEPAIEALVADSGFAHFGVMIERQFVRLSGLPRFFAPGALAFAWWMTGQRLAQVEPLAAAPALANRPLLVVHSAGDSFVPVDDAVAIAAAARAECWITDSEGHIGSFAAAPAIYTERVRAFFVRHLAS